MKKKLLLIIVLLATYSTTTLSMQECKQPEHQEAEQVAQSLGSFQIGENWNSKHRNMRLRSIAYKALAQTRKTEIYNITRQQIDAFAQLNQEKMSHEQTRNQLHIQEKLTTKAIAELNQRTLKIEELQTIIEQLNNINEQLIHEQADYGL